MIHTPEQPTTQLPPEPPSGAESETKPQTKVKAAEEEEEEFTVPRFVGALTCRSCHITEAIGNQYDVWANNPHAKAYYTLASKEAKEIATKLKIKEPPHRSDKCLRCHVTGYGLPRKFFIDYYAIEDGISCEACHGPGKGYAQQEIMIDPEKSREKGLVAVPDATICESCHNKESPTFKGFNYEEAVKKIAHPRPKHVGKR